MDLLIIMCQYIVNDINYVCASHLKEEFRKYENITLFNFGFVKLLLGKTWIL